MSACLETIASRRLITRLANLAVYVMADDFYTSTATASLIMTKKNMVDRMEIYKLGLGYKIIIRNSKLINI